MWVLLSVLLNASAQIFLKKFANFSAGIETFNAKQYLNLNFLVAGFCYLASIMTWINALKSVRLSTAYPMQSLGYVVVGIVSIHLFGEKFSATYGVGLITIILGVLIMAWSLK
jgi:multidrug transporter EmrE-like cation transporter